jgi:hypothetical protein
MSDAVKEMAEVPRQFVKEGTQVSDLVDIGAQDASAHPVIFPLQFINRCTKPNQKGKSCPGLGRFVSTDIVHTFVPQNTSNSVEQSPLDLQSWDSSGTS